MGFKSLNAGYDRKNPVWWVESLLINMEWIESQPDIVVQTVYDR